MFAALRGSKVITGYLLKTEGYNSLTALDEVNIVYTT